MKKAIKRMKDYPFFSQQLIKYTVLVCSLSIASLNTIADNITGKIEFNKKPPYVGVLYSEDKNAEMTKGIVDQKEQEFLPMLVVNKPGQPLTFQNSDSVDHNIFANDKKAKVRFDVGSMSVGASKEIITDWEENSIIRINCKVHPKMRGYIANISSNSIQKFKFNRNKKSFDINLNNISPETSNIILLLPKYNKVIVSIAKGESKTADLLKKDKVVGKITMKRE